MIVSDARAIKIANSRKEAAISVLLETKSGKVQSSAPSGKSRGKYEAEPFSFKGIDFSISFANAILRKIVSERISFNYFEDLEKFEKMLREYDKTKNWSMIGANTVFAIEACLLKAMALSNNQELWQFLNEKSRNLPMPVGNCIGGGQHVRKEKKADFQEFLFIPKAKHFFDAYFMNLQAYKEAKNILIEKDAGWRNELTDENAMAPALRTEELLEIMQAVSKKITEKFSIPLNTGIDAASSSMWNGAYNYKNPKISRNPEEQLNYISEIIKKYNLFYVEDPFQEDDYENFAKLTKQSKCLIVGDDLTATQPERLEEAIKKKSVNAVIVKPNQNGSLVQTKKFVDIAKENKITLIISHRSGETGDATIADLAVGWNIPYIKTGILGKERFAKLSRLLKIERDFGK